MGVPHTQRVPKAAFKLVAGERVFNKIAAGERVINKIAAGERVFNKMDQAVLRAKTGGHC